MWSSHRSNPVSPGALSNLGIRARLAFAGILLVALGLRLTGIGFNLDVNEPAKALLDQVDERGMADSVVEALAARDLNPRDFLNRGPGAFLLFLGADLVVLGTRALFSPASWEAVLAEAQANTSLVQLTHRLVSAAFGMLTVALLVLALRRECGTAAALWAGALLAVAYQHVRDSHLGRVDVIWAYFTLLTLVRAWELLRAPSLANHALVGLFAGITMAMKYPGGLVALVLIAAHGQTRRAARARGQPLPPIRFLVLGLAVIPVGAVIAFPGVWAAWDDVIETFGFAWTRFAPEPEAGGRLRALGLHLRYSLGAGLGETTLFLVPAGIVLAWRACPAGRLLAWGVLATAPAILVTSFIAPRLADPLLVLLAASAGIALGKAWARVPRWAGIGLAAATLAPSLARSLAYDWLILQPDTRLEMLAELARRGLPRGEVLAFGGLHSLPRPMLRNERPFLSSNRIRFGASITREPQRAEDAEARFDELLARPPKLILWCESDGALPGTEDFAALVKSAYREVLRLDGRSAPFRLPGAVGTDMLPYDRPWLMKRPGPALVLHERIDP